MKRFFALALALIMLLSMAGCGSDKGNEKLEAELAETQQELADVQEELAETKQKLTETEQELSKANASGGQTVTAINATVNGKASITINQDTELTAMAALEEGQIVEGWKVNGVLQEGTSGDALVFTAKGNTVVEAIVRQEKKLTAINATIRFLDAKGKAAGDTLTEFVFEKEYTNPVTKETVPGGKISAEIKAVIPSGKVVDYWLINGVPYYYNSTVSSFIVKDLDETTVYEVVLKDKPVTYYKVECEDCNFNGKTSGYVEAGKTITVEASYYKDYGYFYINGTKYNSSTKHTITITVNENMDIEFYAVIN